MSPLTESIGVHDNLLEGSVLATRGGSILDDLGRVHVVSESKTTTGLLGNGELVTGNHLDLDTKGLGIVDGLLSVVTRGVEDGEKTDELEASSGGVLLLRVANNLLEGDSESTKTTAGELLDVLLKLVLHLRGLVASADWERKQSATELTMSKTGMGTPDSLSMMIPVIPLVTRLTAPVDSSM